MTTEDTTRLQEQVKTLFKNFADHETDNKEAFKEVFAKLDEINKNYASRLPVWATFLIAALTAAVGWLAH